jgi:hypothetical protein
LRFYRGYFSPIAAVHCQSVQPLSLLIDAAIFIINTLFNHNLPLIPDLITIFEQP